GALNTDGFAAITAVSCTSAGNCSAGGDYATSRRHDQAFVVDETDGTWGSAQEVPGMATLNKGGSAIVNWMSCASTAHCSAVGDYLDGAGHDQALVVTRT